MRTVLVCVRTPLAAQQLTNAAARLGLAAVVRTAVSDPEAMLRLAQRPVDVVDDAGEDAGDDIGGNALGPDHSRPSSRIKWPVMSAHVCMSACLWVGDKRGSASMAVISA